MRRITYLPEIRIVLTKRCAYACAFCNFPTTPSPTLPSLRELRRLLRVASEFGASTVRLEAGDEVASMPEIQSQTRYHGCPTWSDYLLKICSEVARQDGRYILFPQLDAGRLPTEALRKLKTVQPTLRIMLDNAAITQPSSTAETPQKNFAQRIAALEEAGRAGLPAETGLLVGLGETPEAAAEAARVVSKIHGKFGHIQTFNITPFAPQRFTNMSTCPPPNDEHIIRILTAVRQALDSHIPLSAEIAERPTLALEAAKRGLLEDLGHITFGYRDKTRFDMPMQVANLCKSLATFGFELTPRIPLSENYLVNGPVGPVARQTVERYMQSRFRSSSSVAI